MPRSVSQAEIHEAVVMMTTPDANGKKTEDAKDASKANGAGHKEEPELNGGAAGKPEKKDDKKGN